MSKQNHSRSMSAQERVFWREAFVAMLKKGRYPSVKRAADVADDCVAEYRKRITWRQP